MTRDPVFAEKIYCNGNIIGEKSYSYDKITKKKFIKYANICGRPDWYDRDNSDDITSEDSDSSSSSDSSINDIKV